MVLDTSFQHTVKTRVKFKTKCPCCGENLNFGIEPEIIAQTQYFPFPHLVLHGNPLHAVIAYIDGDLKVRAVESSNSIEVLRNSATFSEFLKKWTNPF